MIGAVVRDVLNVLVKPPRVNNSAYDGHFGKTVILSECLQQKGMCVIRNAE